MYDGCVVEAKADLDQGARHMAWNEEGEGIETATISLMIVVKNQPNRWQRNSGDKSLGL